MANLIRSVPHDVLLRQSRMRTDVLKSALVGPSSTAIGPERRSSVVPVWSALQAAVASEQDPAVGVGSGW